MWGCGWGPRPWTRSAVRCPFRSGRSSGRPRPLSPIPASAGFPRRPLMLLRSTAAALALAGGVIAWARPAAGQRWQVDLAGNAVGYDTAGNIRSASISPLLDWSARLFYGSVSGALAAFEGGGWTSQGHGDVSLLFTPLRSSGALHAEVVGSVDGSAHSG